jgi:MFS family permease
LGKKQFYYGWVIVITCFFIFFTIVAIKVSPSSLFIVPVTEYFGFSRGDFSISLTLISTIGMLVQLVYGLFVSRIGVRGMISIGAILAPIGFLINYRANSLAAFYAAGVIIGISFALTSITSISILINNWFDQRQGFLLGIIASGSGFGGGFFSIVIGNHIVQQGFKSAYLLSAILLAAVAVPVILLIRSKPNPEQQSPLKNLDAAPKTGRQTDSNLSQLSLKQFFNTPTNLLALLGIFIIGVTFYPVLVSAPPYLVDKGFDARFVAAITGAIFFVLGVAKIVIGLIHDRLGIKTSLLIGVSTFMISAMLLIWARQPWMVWLFVLFIGISLSTLTVLVPLYVKKIVGPQSYSRYLGVFVAVSLAGSGIGIPMINYTYDLTGSYTRIIAAFAGLAGLGYLLTTIPLNNKMAIQDKTGSVLNP